MKKYWFLFLLALPFLGQAKCTINGNSTAIQGVNLDLTTGNGTVTFSPNLTGEFTCNSTQDKVNVLKTLDNYVVEIKENQNNNQSIYIKFNLDVGDGFPVDTGGRKTYSVNDTINNKSIALTASYIKSPDSNANVQTVYSNSFILNAPAVVFPFENGSATNFCYQNIIFYFICYVSNRLPTDAAYQQNLNVNITKHKPTTCSFSQPTYEIRMPETTISEMQSANNTKSGSIDLVLNCDSVYNVTTNPVTFKVARGEWDDSGTILKNTSLNGAKGVGFQIYNGNATTPLKLGDTLMNKLTKMAAIENQYTFPITAKYVRVKEEAIQPGEVQSKAIFAVSYD
ncbi:fimbrial protein [Escherichia marmotae]|uniref:fimbrial protein n=1 Tax=Escherichia marmotae TaxID=1499973 RepID=UPI000E219DAB|nr:fimbrial protein [Escherichia marmotae]